MRSAAQLVLHLLERGQHHLAVIGDALVVGGARLRHRRGAGAAGEQRLARRRAERPYPVRHVK